MWELSINERLYNPNSTFGIIFELVGEAPALIPFCYLAFVLVGLAFDKWRVRERKWECLIFACYLFSVLVLSAIAIEFLKRVVGRVRFRDMLPPYLEYTPFYALGHGGRSFPSGHAGMGALSILLVDLNSKYKVFKSNTVPLAISLIFTLLVCLSRLIMGAHYLTDLLFGVLIALLSRILMKTIFSRLKINL